MNTPNKSNDDPQLTSWMEALNVSRSEWSMTEDGKITVLSQHPVHIPPEWELLPIEFKYINGSIIAHQANLKSLKGFPQAVSVNLTCSYTMVESFELITRTIGKHAYIGHSRPYHLKGIQDTHADWIVGGTLGLAGNPSHVLGLAQIPGIKRVIFSSISSDTFDISHNDVFQFQEQLLEAGLVDLARL
jgi:hypothetical protein